MDGHTIRPDQAEEWGPWHQSGTCPALRGAPCDGCGPQGPRERPQSPLSDEQRSRTEERLTALAESIKEIRGPAAAFADTVAGEESRVEVDPGQAARRASRRAARKRERQARRRGRR